MAKISSIRRAVDKPKEDSSWQEATCRKPFTPCVMTLKTLRKIALLAELALHTKEIPFAAKAADFDSLMSSLLNEDRLTFIETHNTEKRGDVAVAVLNETINLFWWQGGDFLTKGGQCNASKLTAFLNMKTYWKIYVSTRRISGVDSMVLLNAWSLYLETIQKIGSCV